MSGPITVPRFGGEGAQLRAVGQNGASASKRASRRHENSRSISHDWRVMSEGCEGQPLTQADNVFEAGFLRSRRECDRALKHVRTVGRAIMSALHVAQRDRHALGVVQVCDNDFGPLRLQPNAAGIFLGHQRAHGIARIKQFGNNDTACLPGRAGHQSAAWS
jgi:hypothetical protein